MFGQMLEAIRKAKRSVRFETYIFEDSSIGRAFRDALGEAQARGVDVQVLLDAWGSNALRNDYWQDLEKQGGSFRWFNPLSLRSLGIRNHRKLMVIDDSISFIGGFNIAPDYEGDGVARGWRDLGLRIEAPISADLAASFDELNEMGDERMKPFPRFRKALQRRYIEGPETALLLSGPGRGRSAFERALIADLRQAKEVKIVAAYFLPTNRVRRALHRARARGAKVTLLFPGRSDVQVSQLASRSYYQSLMRVGMELYEYQPQILHAKLVVMDHCVYVGSANLDRRSFRINFELMVRFSAASVLSHANAAFQEIQSHCLRIDPRTWKQSRSVWNRLKERWSHFLLAGIDPFIARRQLRTLK